ncbi:DEAD/DEAH box helicase [Gloeobacter morelensis]|uniref:DEAD/DEAH box helicase n=1 Tax=Gloeobacter morelensis TaxID=2907343 RepID=UPI001E3F37F7|nr:DEAD/DEAH box helicase [Gloeobacter morelensis]UFP97166.1 DEAD/DEAH box helicase [Gloeobacter morelensis MG652769]
MERPEEDNLQAEIIRASRESSDGSGPPAWLRKGAKVQSPAHGKGMISAVLSGRVYVEFAGGRIVSYPHWEQALNRGQLSPPSAGDRPADGDIRASPSPSGSPQGSGGTDATSAQITDPRFRAFATAFSGTAHHISVTPGRQAQTEELPGDLPDELARALASAGVQSLYSHQAEALTRLRSGQDLMLCTPTASGKTLCFNPAIFESCLADPNVTALYLYPLKALLYDQLSKLEQLDAGLDGGLKIRALSGDTDLPSRREVFSPGPPRLLAANPDILHFWLYKIKHAEEWRGWREYLRRLRWVVLDEAHIYTGNFGAHMASLVRRLRLAVDTVGGDSDRLQFVLASATVGNPEQMALALTGRAHTPERLAVVSHSGAAVGEKTFVSLQPTGSANPESAKIVLEWLRQGISGLVFCNSRSAAKSLLTLIRRMMRGDRLLAGRTSQVSLFYGSVRPEQRARITEALRSGDVRVVVTTSALEAGLDLPSVDAVLLRGYPGSLMATRQRAGRCGRSGPGLVVFLPVASNPLDSYYAMHPGKLLTAPPEQAAFNADYPSLLAAHLKCACAESHLQVDGIEPLFGKAASRVAESLVRRGHLRERGLRLTAPGFPHSEVGLRGDAGDSFRLVDADTDETIEELSALFAYMEAHPEAIYLCLDGEHQEAFYKVEGLDCWRKRAVARRLGEDPEYRTRAISQIDIEQKERLAEPRVQTTPISEGRGRLTLSWGNVATLITGYNLERTSRKNACANAQCQNHRRPVRGAVCPFCRTPTKQVGVNDATETHAFPTPYRLAFEAPMLSVELNPPLRSAVEERAFAVRTKMQRSGIEEPWEGEDIWVAMHSFEHLLSQAVPLQLLMGGHDLAGATFLEHPQLHGTATLFYDASPGGTGASEALFDRFDEFIQSALELAASCRCEAGCPTCLFRHGCNHHNLGLNKELGLYVLELLTGIGTPEQ